jgi:hypothetical protein
VLALHVEVPMVMTSFPSLKVGEEYWNSVLDAWLEAVAVNIYLEVVVACI